MLSWSRHLVGEEEDAFQNALLARNTDETMHMTTLRWKIDGGVRRDAPSHSIPMPCTASTYTTGRVEGTTQVHREERFYSKGVARELELTFAFFGSMSFLLFV